MTGETVARVPASMVLTTSVVSTASIAGTRPALMKSRLYTQIAPGILHGFMTERAIRTPTIWVAATMGGTAVNVPAWTDLLTPAALTASVVQIQPV